MPTVEHFPRPVQLHLYGVEFGVADVRNFLGGHVFKFKHHQHGSVFFRQLVQHPIELLPGLLLFELRVGIE